VDRADRVEPAPAPSEPAAVPIQAGTMPIDADAAFLASLPPGTTIVRRVRGPRRWPGILSGVLAVLMLIATAAGIRIASTLDYSTSTTLAYVAIGLSVAAIIVGLVAAIKGWGRGAGIVGIVVAVLGNPLVLLYVLNFLSGR
jgi:hypothetical protein